jgi:hypothetical protein
MFAQKLVVEIIVGQERRLCPLEWLDSFCMRNFTGSAEFDDTLPVAEGQLEAGFRVSPARLAQALGDWATQRGKGGGQPVRVEVHEDIHKVLHNELHTEVHKDAAPSAPDETR